MSLETKYFWRSGMVSENADEQSFGSGEVTVTTAVRVSGTK